MKRIQSKRPVVFSPKPDVMIWVIGFLVISLAILPFMAAFNDILTNWVISLKTYRWLTEIVVPQQIRWTVTILRVVGVEAQATSEYILVPINGKPMVFELIWNCIGWQSLVMFVLSAGVMLRGKYGWLPKVKAVSLGIVGTVFINTIRIAVVIWLFRFLGGGAAVIFHDYGALLINTSWLIVFWWFSYEFILEAQS